MTTTEVHAKYTSTWGTETTPGCQMFHMKPREVSVSLFEQTGLYVKYPHQTVRCMGEKESDSHHTGLALE